MIGLGGSSWFGGWLGLVVGPCEMVVVVERGGWHGGVWANMCVAQPHMLYGDMMCVAKVCPQVVVANPGVGGPVVVVTKVNWWVDGSGEMGGSVRHLVVFGDGGRCVWVFGGVWVGKHVWVVVGTWCFCGWLCVPLLGGVGGWHGVDGGIVWQPWWCMVVGNYLGNTTVEWWSREGTLVVGLGGELDLVGGGGGSGVVVGSTGLVGGGWWGGGGHYWDDVMCGVVGGVGTMVGVGGFGLAGGGSVGGIGCCGGGVGWLCGGSVVEVGGGGEMVVGWFGWAGGLVLEVWWVWWMVVEM
ncbi:hypothetical protein Tco_1274764 [Tanacetum coccineum]